MNSICRMCNICNKTYPGLVLECMKKVSNSIQINQTIINNYKIVEINKFNNKRNYNKNKLSLIERRIDDMII
jgi:hypothetical protein